MTCVAGYTFFPRVILYNFSHFCSFMVWIWGFKVGVLDWVVAVGFSVDGVWGLWCGAFWVFRLGLSIYTDKPGKKMSACGGRRRKHRASTAKPSTMRVNRVRFGNFHTTNPIILGHICETWLA